MLRILAALILLQFTITGCSHKETNTESGSTASNRPHDPFVFRSVLDWQPRMVTMALSDDIWAAYSTQRGALYKIWGGTVHFDGPVYTQAHGPQPITIGNAYFVNEYKNPWYLTNANKDSIGVNVRYKGHKIVDDHAVLMYHLTNDQLNTPISVEEMVEASRSEGGQPIYQRTFTTKDVPEGMNVHLLTNVHSIVTESNISTTGTFVELNKESVPFGTNKKALSINGDLMLQANGTTEFNVTLLLTPLIENTNEAGKDSEAEEDLGLPEGGKLIAKSDCKTCHNKNVKTIGPSYVSISQKYANTPENVAMLANKIKIGGSGVWGNQVMTPHPDVPRADLESMASYILSLNNGQKTESTDVNNNVMVLTPVDVKEDEVFIPGLMTRVYDIPKGTNKMPSTNGKKSKFAGVLNKLDNINGNDFKELEDDFMIECQGYLYIEEEGKYNLELWSDDGSILYVGDKLVIDNDGNHGTEMKSTDVMLTKGYYPIKVQFYQGGGGKFLSFNWTRPSGQYPEVIPTFNLAHTTDQQGDLANTRLPMSILTKIPGDREPLNDVHPSFDLSQARPEDFTPKVGGMDFMSDGSMIVSTWDAAGSVYKVTNASSGDPSKMIATKIAAGLAEPLGLKVVDDRIYVMQKQEITELIDNNNDGIIDEYRTLADGWGVSANFHEFGFGLAYKDGYLYATLATAIEPGGASTKNQIQDRGKAIKVDIKTGEVSYIASGLRTPNGIGVGYNNDIYIADNQGDWLPSCKILHVTDGAWFGSRSVDFEGTAKLREKPPVVWLPQDEIGNSPSTPMSINVGPYKGQMIHGEVTHGGVKRVFVEEVNGQLQGAVFRFIQGLEAGVNRMVWGPDGALYVGGIGNPGNWGQTGKKWYGLQRLAYNDKSTFEMLSVSAKSNGFEITLTEPLKEGDGWNPADFEVKQWYYKPTIEYGGPKLDYRPLKVKSASVSDNGKKIFVEIDGMKKGHVVYIRLNNPYISTNNNSLWSTEAWYTLNEIPTTKGTVLNPPKLPAVNELSETEIKEGWKLLFDGKKIEQFRNFRKQTIGSGWIVDDNAIHLNAVKENGKWQAKDGGDIITNDAYENFEFKVDWKITNCGNSGIIYNVVESDKYDYVWQTGPEMQILDNVCHPDTRFVTHRAADLYDMIESKFVTAKPAGEWNQAMIRSKDGKVDFYLNGYKVVSFLMHDDNWKKMIANSKFKDMPDFGLARKGHIALQDHGDKVWFRNIKIREI